MKTSAPILVIAMAAKSAMLMADLVRASSGDAGTVIARDGPHRGAIQTQVERRYGPPQQRMAAVGNPLI